MDKLVRLTVAIADCSEVEEAVKKVLDAHFKLGKTILVSPSVG